MSYPSIHAYQHHRWNNQPIIHPIKCSRVSFHYEQNGLLQPGPYYFAISTHQGKMGPITKAYARRPFSFAFLSIDQNIDPSNVNAWASFDNDYWFNIPIINQKAYTNNRGGRSTSLMVNMLRHRGEVEGYNGKLGGYRGIHNVVLEECGGNGQASFGPYSYDNNDGNKGHFMEPLYRWNYPSKLPLKNVH